MKINKYLLIVLNIFYIVFHLESLSMIYKYGHYENNENQNHFVVDKLSEKIQW